MLSIILLTLYLPLVASLGGRERVLIGGKQEATGKVSTDDEAVVFAVQAVNDWLASERISHAPRKLVKIVKAQTQVVAGEKLYLTLQLSPWQPLAKDEYCDVVVVFKPWLNGTDRLVMSGQPNCSQTPPQTAADHQAATSASEASPGSAKTPNLLGSRKPLNSHQLPQDAADALNFAVNEVNRRSNSLYLFALRQTDGIEVTQQIVAGKKFCFKNVPLLQTGCNKQTDRATISSGQCALAQDGQRMVCDLCVWWQAWRKPQYTLEDFNRDSCSTAANTPAPH